MEAKIRRIMFAIEGEPLDILEVLSKAKDVPMERMLLRAIGLMRYVEDEVKAGGKILVQRVDKSVVEVEFK